MPMLFQTPKKPKPFLWLYYETAGDGMYDLKLFKSEESAEAHKKKIANGYGKVEKIEVND